MIVPAVLYLLVAVRPASRLLTRLAATAGCFLIPVVGYLGWFAASHGQWNFTTFDGAFLYGRVADFASCQGLELPAYEKPLCPAQPPALRNADFYTWNPQSPQWTFTPRPGCPGTRWCATSACGSCGTSRSATPKPSAATSCYGFSPVRGAGPEQYSPAYLQFGTSVRPDRAAYASIAALGYPAPALEPGPAAFLTGYGRWVYLPGPVLAAGLVLALGGLVVSRCRDQRHAAVHRQRDRDPAPAGHVRHLRLAVPAAAAQPDPGGRDRWALTQSPAGGQQVSRRDQPALPGDGHPAASTQPAPWARRPEPRPPEHAGWPGRDGGSFGGIGSLPFSWRAGWPCGSWPRSPTGRRCCTSTRRSTWRGRAAPRRRGTGRCCGCSTRSAGSRWWRRSSTCSGWPWRWPCTRCCRAPQGAAVGGGAGRGAGAARRVPAPARADDHAGRAVRDHDRGGAGAAAVAADGQRAAGGGRGARAGGGRHRAGDRRGARGARRGLRRGRRWDRRRLAAAGGPGGAGGGVLRAAGAGLHDRDVSSPAGTSGWAATGRGPSTGGRRPPRTAPPSWSRRTNGRCAPPRRRRSRWAASTGCCTARPRPATPCRCRPASPAGSCSTGSRWPSSGSSRSGWPGRWSGTRSGSSRSPGTATRRSPRSRAGSSRPPTRSTRAGTRWPSSPGSPEQNGSGGDLVAVRPAAAILRSYQLGGGFTPGPLYAAFLAPGRCSARC